MRVGVPKEIKEHEYRVGLTPESVREFAGAGHELSVETGAGAGINSTDQAYLEGGATIVDTAAEIFAKSEMKPQESEWTKLRENQIVFAFLHLAADLAQTKGLLASGCTTLAYETVTGPDGQGLPLLAPMSQVAGRLAIAIDQGGCFESSHATTHAAPTFIKGGVVHYCVANMPGAVPLTSSHALNNAALPYGLALAAGGLGAIANNPGLRGGLNVHRGHVTHPAIAGCLGFALTPPAAALEIPGKVGRAPGLPARRGAIRSHCESFTTLRSKADLYFLQSCSNFAANGNPPQTTVCP